MSEWGILGGSASGMRARPVVAGMIVGLGIFTAPSAEAIQFLGWREHPGETGSGASIGGWDPGASGQWWRVPANGFNGVNYLELPASTVWAAGTDITLDTIDMAVSRQDFGIPRWPPVFAQAQIAIGPGGAVSPAVVHAFSSTGGIPAGSGLGASVRQQGQFAFSGISALTPLYWGVEWTLTLNNPTQQPWIAMEVTMAAAGHRNDPLTLTFNMMTATLTGSWFGSYTASDLFGFNSTAGISAFSGGDPYVPVDFSYAYRIAFSDTPFTDIPDQVVDAGVPAPGAAALIGLGLVGLGLVDLGAKGRRAVRKA